MKKIFLVIIATFASQLCFAQEKISWTISENNVIGLEEDLSSNMFSADFGAVFSFSPKFSIGANAGLGICNPIKYSSMWKVDDVEMSESSIFLLSLYARGQYAFSTKPNHFFIGMDLGTTISSVEGFDGTDFNPYGFFVRPHIGAQFKLGNSGLDLFALVGIQMQNSKTDDIQMKYSEVLKKYVYDDFERTKQGFTGLYFSLGIKL